MGILSPKIPAQLARVDDFSSYVSEFLAEELPIIEMECTDEKGVAGEFRKIDIRKSRFTNCTFTHCDFEKASFVDVIFEACDFSNSKFSEAYFERCQFSHCKCIGVDMSLTMIKSTKFEQSNFTYSSFNQTKMLDVFFDRIDFSEASMGEAKLKKFAAKNSLFVKNNFFQRMSRDSRSKLPRFQSSKDAIGYFEKNSRVKLCDLQVRVFIMLFPEK